MGSASTALGCATETVSFPSDAFTVKAFLARPSAVPDPASALLLLHEWWGLNDPIKETARRLAQAGHVVLAPDLYSRLGCKVAQAPQEAASLMSALSSQAALRDLNAATRYLKAQAFVDPLRIGAIGFSMGGTFALNQATHNSDLKAVVSFYGKVPPIETLEYLLCPVLYHYAAKDGWVTRQDAERLEQGFEKFGKKGRLYAYPNADHSFCNEARPEVYRAEDAVLAWGRTLDFLREHLSLGG